MGSESIYYSLSTSITYSITDSVSDSSIIYLILLIYYYFNFTIYSIIYLSMNVSNPYSIYHQHSNLFQLNLEPITTF